MARFALSASATLLPLNGISSGSKKWSKLFPFRSTRNGTDFSYHTSFRRGGVRFVASSAMAGNGGVTEVFDGTTPPRIYSWPDKKKPRICILGGGFGGLYTALRLESLVWPDDNKPQVVLVDQSERFVFKPMLYELLSGEVDVWEIAPRFSDLLANSGVQFFQDKVKVLRPLDHVGANGRQVTARGGTVLLESGFLVEYDWLVLALGAEPKLDVVAGALEFALPFSTLDDAIRVDRKLKQLERRNFSKRSVTRVAVVGCGYSGVELAATIAERLQDQGIVYAINVQSTILPTSPPGNRESAMKVLLSRKVQLLLGYLVNSIKVAEDVEATAKDDKKYKLELKPADRGLESQVLEADIVLWTVGSNSPLPRLESSENRDEFPLNGRGQVETDETLRVKDHPRTFALGDSSSLRDANGSLLPATAQVALQQADFTGWNLWAAINGRPLLPFRFQNLGEMMSLGRSDAAIAPTFIEGLTLDGPLGHTARKLAYLLRLPTDEHRIKVGISWLAKSAIDSVASLQTNIVKTLSGQ